MRKYINTIVAAVLLLFVPVLQSGCGTPPNERVAQVQTLKMVGHAAEATVDSAAQFYASGLITQDELRQVAQFYDYKFQPAFRIASDAVRSNLDTAAPQGLIALSAQLSALVLTFKNN